MCYILYLSTTSPDDLAGLPSDLYRFLPLTENDDRAIVSLLEHPNRWFLQCRYGGCSCHFRHMMDGNVMEFGSPEDWWPEDADDIEATQAVYDVLAGILADGHRVDLIDIWNGAKPEAVTVLDVSLSEVERDSFRFFENYRFKVRA